MIPKARTRIVPTTLCNHSLQTPEEPLHCSAIVLLLVTTAPLCIAPPWPRRSLLSIAPRSWSVRLRASAHWPLFLRHGDTAGFGPIVLSDRDAPTRATTLAALCRGRRLGANNSSCIIDQYGARALSPFHFRFRSGCRGRIWFCWQRRLVSRCRSFMAAGETGDLRLLRSTTSSVARFGCRRFRVPCLII